MVEIPEGAKVPEDRKPAAQVEAEGGGTTVLTWHGLSFTVPTDPDDLPGDFLEAAELGRSSRMIAICLGGKQFAAFKKTKPTVGQYREVGDMIADLYGFEDLGN